MKFIVAIDDEELDEVFGPLTKTDFQELLLSVLEDEGFDTAKVLEAPNGKD